MSSSSARQSQPLTNVSGYLRTLSRIRSEIQQGKQSLHLLAFRGHEKECWELASSAERRLKRSSPGGVDVTNETFIQYHEDLLAACKLNRFNRRGGEELHDLELLADLQHHRAATCLIDFTRNALVALWFACENTQHDGKVFVIDTAEEDEFLEIGPKDIDNNSISDILRFATRDYEEIQSDEMDNSESSDLPSGGPRFWRWNLASVNERIPAQHSLFIFGPLSSGKPKSYEMVISAGSKARIREELKEFHDIYEETLFPDFAGFAYTQRHDATYGPSALDHDRFGVQSRQRGDYSTAIQHLRHATQLDPFNTRARYNLARSLVRERNFEEAVEEYSELIRLDGSNSRGYRGRAIAYERSGQLDEAIRDCDKALELDPKSPFSYRLRARVHRGRSELDEAIQDYGNAIELEPENPLSYRLRGRIHEIKGDLANALRDWDKAVELSPENESARRIQTRILEKLALEEASSTGQ